MNLKMVQLRTGVPPPQQHDEKERPLIWQKDRTSELDRDWVIL